MGTEDETPQPIARMPEGKKTAEEWATAKKMLPEFTEGPLDATRAKKYPKAKKPLVHNKAFAPFAAAKASLKWPIGMELTEKEFDEAIALNGGPAVEGIEAHVFR